MTSTSVRAITALHGPDGQRTLLEAFQHLSFLLDMLVQRKGVQLTGKPKVTIIHGLDGAARLLATCDAEVDK